MEKRFDDTTLYGVSNEMYDLYEKVKEHILSSLPNTGDEMRVDMGYVGELTFNDLNGDEHLFAGVRRTVGNDYCLLGYRDGRVYEVYDFHPYAVVQLFANYGAMRTEDELIAGV